MARLANFWILGRAYFLNPNASVTVFSTDKWSAVSVSYDSSCTRTSMRSITRVLREGFAFIERLR